MPSRALSEYAVDMASFAKYTAISTAGSSPPRSALGLCGADGGFLEFGAVNPRSGIMFARHEGRLYVGYNPTNPMSVDADGECLERFAWGITLQSLVALLSSSDGAATTAFDTRPREEWNAGFKLLEPPQGHTGALRFRVYITAPYASAHAATYQDEYTMHLISDLA